MSVVRRLPGFIRRRIDDYVDARVAERLREVGERVRTLEYRAFNRRFYAIEQIAEYLLGAEIEGDYLEFGVFKGTTFSHAWRQLSAHFPRMRFVAFDSFEGLPEPRGVDSLGGYTSRFRQAAFRCPEDSFLSFLREEGVDLARVRVVKGWFHETLASPGAAEHGVTKVAAAWIDCDLYESTVPVLRYIAPMLSVGSVVVFDDWHCFRNHPDLGEQRACREWLEANPRIRLNRLFSFGWHGVAFTVSSC